MKLCMNPVHTGRKLHSLDRIFKQILCHSSSCINHSMSIYVHGHHLRYMCCGNLHCRFTSSWGNHITIFEERAICNGRLICTLQWQNQMSGLEFISRLPCSRTWTIQEQGNLDTRLANSVYCEIHFLSWKFITYVEICRLGWNSSLWN